MVIGVLMGIWTVVKYLVVETVSTTGSKCDGLGSACAEGMSKHATSLIGAVDVTSNGQDSLPVNNSAV